MKLGLILRGAAMGVAEVIPGVSGGTIAFITGIYEQLIENIANIDLSLFKIIKNRDWDGLKAKFDFGFLFSILVGMAAGFVTAIFAITYLKDNYPIYLNALFFGLILGSVVYIFRKIDNHKALHIVGLIVTMLISYYVTIMNPVEADGNLLYIFICGTIAISALMLPGISGSLLLLMLGAYYIVIPAVRGLLSGDLSGLSTVVVFALGCLVGVLTIAKLLKYAFAEHKDLTLSLMTGLMIGSLNKLWPWQNVLSTRLNSKGETVPFETASVLSSNFVGDPLVIGTTISAIVGILLVYGMSRVEVKES